MDNHEDRLAGLDFLYKALADKRGLDIVAMDLEGSSAV